MPALQLTPGTATATGNGTTTASATINQDAGTITTEALTTAAGVTCTLTVFNGLVTTNSMITCELYNGTNSAGDPSIGLMTPGNGQFTVTIVNRHAANALNGTLKLQFIVFN